MASRIEKIGDFHVSEKQGWHKLTTIAKPTKEHFPVIREVPVMVHDGSNMVELMFNGGRVVVPVSSVGDYPVAMPYTSANMGNGSYTLFQPREAWDYVAECLAGTQHEIESICMLAGQSIWSVSAVLTELNAISKHGIDYRLNFNGGLDRSFSPQADVNTVRVVCANTVNASRSQGQHLFKRRLTKNFRVALNEARAEIEKACGMAAIFEKAYSQAQAKPCQVQEAREVYAGFVVLGETSPELSTRQFNRVEEYVNAFQRGLGNKGETRADALNGLTEVLTRATPERLKEMTDSQVAKLVVSSEQGAFAQAKSHFANIALADSNEAWQSTRQTGELVLKDYLAKV